MKDITTLLWMFLPFVPLYTALIILMSGLWWDQSMTDSVTVAFLCVFANIVIKLLPIKCYSMMNRIMKILFCTHNSNNFAKYPTPLSYICELSHHSVLQMAVDTLLLFKTTLKKRKKYGFAILPQFIILFRITATSM